jgi:hypothetical protein
MPRLSSAAAVTASSHPAQGILRFTHKKGDKIRHPLYLMADSAAMKTTPPVDAPMKENPINRWARLLALPSRKTRQRVIIMDDDGFSVTFDDSRAARIDWSSVAEITAFKRDLFGYDEICLGFRCGSDDGFCWVGKEDLGFSELQTQVGQRFEGILQDWWRAVAFPAFTENWTSIWQRPPTE